jgi:hypothetical protein
MTLPSKTVAMLNVISLSMCGVLSSGVVLTSTPSSQPLPVSFDLNGSTHLATVSQEPVETPIHLTDADGSSGDGDRRGAGRRN